MSFPDTLRFFGKHPGMVIGQVDFNSAMAFLLGYDAGNERGLLLGFREWLIVRVGYGNNFAWPELLLRLVMPETDAPRERLGNIGDHQPIIESALARIEEFWNDRASPNGLRLIYFQYDAWLRSQSWYCQSSPHWIAPEGVIKFDKESK